VTKSLANDLRIQPILKQQRGATVTKILQAEACGQSGLLQNLFEVAETTKTEPGQAFVEWGAVKGGTSRLAALFGDRHFPVERMKIQVALCIRD
jgi:hypothetical protein